MYLSIILCKQEVILILTAIHAEQIFHVFILGLVVGLRDYYHIHSNQESGLGRFDVIFIPKDKKKRNIIRV